jgi:hypothetical protein
MSTVILGQSDYPLKYKNVSGDVIPAYGIFKLEGGTRQSSNELNPHADLVAADGEEALYVNSGLAVANNGYGNGRSIGDGPFWVLYNPGNAPANGDVVGPVDGETYVDATGSGSVVIYKDTDKGLVLCEKLGGSGNIDLTGLLLGAWTTTEYDATTGAPIRSFYRGTSRTVDPSVEYDAVFTSEGRLFVNGTADVIGDNPIGALYDTDSSSLLWLTDRNGLTAVTDLQASYTTSVAPERRSGRHCLEAGDGFLWLACDGAVARVDPDTGEFTHRISVLGGAGTTVYLYPCPTSGSVIIRPGTLADSDRISIINSSGVRTHGYSAVTPTDLTEGGGVLALCGLTNATTLSATDLSTISSGNPTGTETSICTDGTTVWCLQDEVTDKIRAFAASDMTTELWNANAVGVTNAFLIHNPVNGYVYQFNGTQFHKLDPTDGSVEWSSSSFGGSTTSCRHWVAFGSDFVVLSVRNGLTVNLHCLNDSDGTTRWSDFNGRIGNLNVTSSLFILSHGTCVTDDDRVFVTHGYKQQ